ncbi:SDR family NAD(P)-dependent oxidoreductase [Peribacillus frigoritolerans]|uniref:SDR family NAD(P)-dependent oxidoreductase n=1 Tax=Peribacillus frigoritolerans TaxID=450367 RepID=UPI00105A4EB8|nr:SDR family NAD(P)-dependent oxidoreductase [Peribacillus frigoritolerans]TDL80042.1 SDR family oxidoreductase [Peribacillus frigoritolerans]
MRLAGKVAVVTGGAGGIGKATAMLFAEQGAKVVIGDSNSEAGEKTAHEIREKNLPCLFVKTDVTDSADVQALMKTAAAEYGGLDILFNNAGVSNQSVKIGDMETEEWDRVVDINLKGVFLGIKHAVPFMQQSGGGSIINTSSVLGMKGKKRMAPYNASKAGVIALTKNAALDYGKENIRVNAIAPGVIDTSIIDEWRNDDRRWEIYTKSNALARIGQPEEIAKAVLFLASDDASYVTAATLLVDGGTITF